jgi:VCBS repeat-containing protein
LTFSFVTQPTKGVVTLNDPTTGRYTYTPNLNATGSDSFTYRVNDGQADSNTATITVTITPVNDVPIGTADHYTVGEDGVLTATTVLANDHDADGDPLSAKFGSNPAHGTLNLNADGTFTYTPVADYNGPDSFTYLPNDGHADGAAVTVSITVTPANDLPLANGVTYSIAEDGILTVSALGVLANDSDKEANPLTAVLKTNPAHGVLALHADGSFTYTPTANYNGPDSFTYAAHDGTGEGNIATVAITVNAQNDAPMGAPDSYTLMEDAVLQILVPGLLGNDSDPDGDALRVAQGPSILTTAPVHGVLKAMGNDGSFTYQPSANYNGPDSFTYVVTDGKAQSAPVTVNLIIRAQNDAPSSANDSYTVAHNATLKVSAKKGVLKNDSDTDGDVLRSLVVSQPTRGLLHMQLDGSFTYNPPSGNCNADSTDAFTYWANDGAADSNVATVNITIHCVNRAPVANGDVYSVQQGVQLAIPAPGLMVNDSDPDGNQLTAVLVTQPTRGALGFNPNGGFVYKAPTAGADSFTYKVTDGALDSSVVTVSINVTATNQVPLAGNDSYRTSKNVALQVSAPGVVGNDIDADGNTLTPTVMAQPTHGSLHMNLDGSFIYTPSNNYVGLDSFVYVAHDGSAPSNAATVTIDVANANFAPVAANDSYSTAYNVTLTVPGPGLLANDSDPDANQPLRVVVASQPTKGTLALGVGGGFTYTPTGGVCASDSADSFTYYANDSVVNSNLATASIAIHCTNRAPVAVADSYTVAQGARLAIPAPGVLVNDADPDGNAITLIDATLTTRGAFAPSSDGSFVYIAPSNFSGTDTFTYKATDGALKSAAVTVSINVTAVNQVPLAGNDSYSTNKNVALQVAGPGVLGNDSDPDGNVLTVQVMAQPTHGTLAMNTNGSFSYTPTNNYVGLDSFTYVAHDGIAPSNAATVTINVSDANYPPVANDDSYSTPYNAKLSVAGPGLLANDRDPDGNQPLMVVVATQPTKGTLSLTSGGGFEYTPTNTGTCASDSTDSFTYYANDSVVNSNLATVTLTLHCTNRAPVAHADNYSIAQSGTLAIPAPGVLVNDSDPDGNPLRMVLVSGPTLGAFAPNADGSFSYVAPNSAGTDSFTYKATDGALESAVTTATITITAVNQIPLAGNDSYRTTKNVALQVAKSGILGNDLDPDGNALSVTVMAQPTHGTLSAKTDGSFSYVPNNNYVGLDTFTYVAHDGTAPSNAATVTIDVADANFAPVAANDSYTVTSGVKLIVPGPGLLANDHDPDGNQPLHVVLSVKPTLGTLMLTPGGGFEYTPKPDAVCSTDKTDKFKYYANDAVVNSNEATVHLSIHCVNQAPVANGDVYSVQQGVQLAIPAPGLMVNDSDPDGNQLTAMLVTPPTLGVLGFNPNGGFTYQASTVGTDSFTYKVTDGAQQSAPVAVNINVTATPTYSIGGVISGLTNPSALTLSNNNTDLLVSNNNGNFVFSGLLVSGTTYNVGVQSQPVGYTCSVTDGQGTVASANVTHIGVVCSVTPGPNTTALLPGGGTASVSLTGGGGTCNLTRAVFVTSGSVGNTPSGWSFPQGVLDLATAGCSPSSVLTIRVTYPTGLPAGTALWKYGPTAANPAPHWYEYPAVISGNTLTYTITDGQLGDDDLTMNGAIVDPAGPGVPLSTTGTVAAIPTLSEWGQLLLGALILLMGYAEFRRHGSRIRKR